MSLLLLRHALSISDNEGDDDSSTMFLLFSSLGYWISSVVQYYGMYDVSLALCIDGAKEEAASIATTEVLCILQSAPGPCPFSSPSPRIP